MHPWVFTSGWQDRLPLDIAPPHSNPWIGTLARLKIRCFHGSFSAQEVKLEKMTSTSVWIFFAFFFPGVVSWAIDLINVLFVWSYSKPCDFGASLWPWYLAWMSRCGSHRGDCQMLCAETFWEQWHAFLQKGKKTSHSPLPLLQRFLLYTTKRWHTIWWILSPPPFSFLYPLELLYKY